MAETQRITIDKSCLLVVEGDDEERLFPLLLEKLNLNDKVQIIKLGGKSNLASKLKVIFLSPPEETGIEILSIGIVMDADNDAAKSFKEICRILQNLKLPVPTTAFQVVQESLKVTVAILPDGKKSGMLEDICLASVAETPEMLCVDAYFECLVKQKVDQPSNTSKARMQAFLAAHNVGAGVGIAAQRGFWKLEDKAFDLLKDFLQQIPV